MVLADEYSRRLWPTLSRVLIADASRPRGQRGGGGMGNTTEGGAKRRRTERGAGTRSHFCRKTRLSYNPLTADRVKSVATTGLFDADCQLNAQSSTCDYVFPAWEKRVCAWSVNVF